MHRETTVGELVLGAARGSLPPPHPDQWLPNAERERNKEEVGREYGWGMNGILYQVPVNLIVRFWDGIGISKENLRDCILVSSLCQSRLEHFIKYRCVEFGS